MNCRTYVNTFYMEPKKSAPKAAKPDANLFRAIEPKKCDNCGQTSYMVQTKGATPRWYLYKGACLCLVTRAAKVNMQVLDVLPEYDPNLR